MNELRQLLADPRRRPLLLGIGAAVVLLALWQRRSAGASTPADGATNPVASAPVLADPTVPIDPAYIDAEQARDAALQVIGARAIMGQWNAGTGFLNQPPTATPRPSPGELEPITPPNTWLPIVNPGAPPSPITPRTPPTVPYPGSAGAPPQPIVTVPGLRTVPGASPPKPGSNLIAPVLNPPTRVVRP